MQQIYVHASQGPTHHAVGLFVCFLPRSSDVKPDNVLLLCDEGVPVRAALADWGMAIRLKEGEKTCMPW